MRFVTLLLVIGMLAVLAGCQVDSVGPSWSAKILHKGENNGEEWRSRDAGMGSTTGYNNRWSWGMQGDK